MRRAQALHASALLVDEHKRFLAPPTASRKFGGESAQLGDGLAVAGKQDEAAGAGFGEQRTLLIAESGAGAAGDEGLEFTTPGLAAAASRGQSRGSQFY